MKNSWNSNYEAYESNHVMANSDVKCGVFPLVRKYRKKSVLSEEYFGEIDLSSPSADRFVLKQNDTLWTCRCRKKPLADFTDSIELILHFRLEKGTLDSAGIGVAVEVQPWSIDNYPIIPAAVYDGNRFNSLKKNYPPLFEPGEHSVDMPVTTTDIPRLGNIGEPFAVEQTTGDASTPAIGFHDSKHSLGCWLLTQQRSRLGNLGLFIEENPERNRARLLVLSPAVRKSRQGLCKKLDSSDTGVLWEAGDQLTIKLRLYLFPAETIPEFLSVFPDIRHEITNNPSLVL